jgi:hypothetical protein
MSGQLWKVPKPKAKLKGGKYLEGSALIFDRNRRRLRMLITLGNNFMSKKLP